MELHHLDFLGFLLGLEVLVRVGLHLGTFFSRQLNSATNSIKGQIVVGGFITIIAQFFNIIPKDNDQVPRSERLDRASFELMSFCKVESGRLC